MKKSDNGLNPSAELPQQTQIPDPYTSSTDEYSDSELSDSEFEQPLDWDDMDPAQRHVWLRDHPMPDLQPSKLMCTESENLTRTQKHALRHTKRPQLFDTKDTKSLARKDREPSPSPNYETLPEQPPSIPDIHQSQTLPSKEIMMMRLK